MSIVTYPNDLPCVSSVSPNALGTPCTSHPHHSSTSVSQLVLSPISARTYLQPCLAVFVLPALCNRTSFSQLVLSPISARTYHAYRPSGQWCPRFFHNFFWPDCSRHFALLITSSFFYLLLLITSFCSLLRSGQGMLVNKMVLEQRCWSYDDQRMLPEERCPGTGARELSSTAA